MPYSWQFYHSFSSVQGSTPLPQVGYVHVPRAPSSGQALVGADCRYCMGANLVLPCPSLRMQDVLGHPATIAVVSHSGVHSLYEAAYHGVPMVSVPFMFEAVGACRLLDVVFCFGAADTGGADLLWWWSWCWCALYSLLAALWCNCSFAFLAKHAPGK